LGLDAWPAALAVLLTWPLLTGSGYPLARDLVFVPRQPWRADWLGLGDESPRAVPLDAVVSLLTHVVDGGVLARVVLPLTLALAGWGAHRAVAALGTPARLVAGGFAVWNPYVVERLALGQWALLLGYASLPWIAVAAGRWRRDHDDRALGASLLWLALASLTPTGGLLGLATLVCFVVGGRRPWLPVLGGVVLQLPWVVAGFVGPAALTSDPAGVSAFAARGEGPGGVLAAVVGMGGVWDRLSVPGTREGGWALATAIVAVLVVLLGHRRLRSHWGGEATRAAGLGVVGLVLALVSSVGPGADLVTSLVQHVPGGGLLRDAQKYAAPWVVLVVCSAAGAVDALVDRVGEQVLRLTLAVCTVLLPLVLLPDATRAVWPTLEPVAYPASVRDLPEVVGSGSQAVVTLPWRAYRGFSWGNGLTSSDPATRLLDRPVLTDDDLQVGPTLVRGESARARRAGTLVPDEPAELGRLGVGWVIVYRDDPAAAALDLAGLEPVTRSAEVAVYRVPDPRRVPGPSLASAIVVGLVDGGVLLLLIGAVRARVRRRRGARRNHVPTPSG
jgi:hypothetical protein